MSWFDATGLANIAKTALKEAQKTIDKALDIKDDDYDDDDLKPAAKECSPSKGLRKQNALIETPSDNDSIKDAVKSNEMPASSWGSFTGSFFQIDNCKKSGENSLLISTQPQKLSLLLSSGKDDKKAAPETELTSVDVGIKSLEAQKVVKGSDRNSSKEFVISENKKCNEKTNEGDALVHHNLQIAPTKLGLENPLLEEKVVPRLKGKRNSSNRNSYVSNRESTLSTDSEEKRSSESVEVLSSLSCTTSPDTDFPSLSASSSLGLPVSSSYTDSVEVIDSLTSPSSIEILVEGTGSGRTTQSSLLYSPKDDVSVNQNRNAIKKISSPKDSGNDVSPESFEVIPDLPEYDEELSINDSYTSASESTGPTVLEPSSQFSHRLTDSINDLSQASSKFRSGDSTPDVITKVPLLNKNPFDVLAESIPQKSVNYRENKSAEMTKSLVEPGKQSQAGVELSEFSAEALSETRARSAQASPTRKSVPKSGYRMKSDESKCQKSDVGGGESLKTHGGPKKDPDEDEICPQGSEKGDFLGTEEICGSVSSFSDTRTIVANDSSCEEIVLESSSEDVGNVPGSGETSGCRSGEKSEGDGNHNNSYYVKSLLSEAMREMSTTRETSPTLSEKSRSDLIKVGSEQTSGHTSGDELETTTSSDIEIISRYSPNGDSSSTASRHSPAKLLQHNSKSKLSLVAVDILGKATGQSKNKGHHREASDGSSFCSEDNFSEVEKLSKKITELTEILEARESRLNDLRKTNLEMQEKNQELRREMELAKKNVSTGFQSVQSESEKDELIKELKEEGEKLSKKELKQANLIKTLRAHEKSQQAALDNNKAQIQNLTKSLEELKADLATRKATEKSLSENVKQMNKKITRQDEEIANLLNQLEKAVIKTEELKLFLDSREKELAKCKELLAAEDFELQDAKSIADSKTKQLERLKAFQENAEIKLEDLTQQLIKAEAMHSEREKHHREEKNELMRRLQEAERRNEELAQSVSTATRPILRQMEALQATTFHERETWEKQERNFQQKLEETETRLSSALYNEKSLKQEIIGLRTKIECLEGQVQTSSKESTAWMNQANSLNKQLDETRSKLENEKSDWEKREENLKAQISDLKGEVASLEQEISNERANAEAERKRKSSLQEQMKEKDVQASGNNNRDSSSPRSSPTLSFGRVSLSESLSSNVWPQFLEDNFETGSISGRCSNVYENLRTGNTASLVENLQAQLKMRDGELSQLQWELQRRDAERATLTAELSSLTSKLEERENGLKEFEATNKSLKELQTKYDALLEMYGEKVEEVDELRLDLEDVKEMYKSQIDQLLKKEKQDFPV